MNTSLLRRSSVLAVATLAFALGTAAATADDIYNTLDGTIDTTVELMPLTLGGANGTTTLELRETNGDGKNGCNLTGSTTLTLSVTSSDPGVATVAPGSVTFDSCGAERGLTVTPVGVGSTTISLTQTASNGLGTFDLAPATFRVTVTAATPTNTAPVVSVTGVTSGASYEFGSVPAALCQVTDAEDGNSTPPAVLSPITGPLAASGLGSQTATCSFTDTGHLTATSSVTYSIVDTTDPTITLVSRTPEANGAGWNKGEVTLTWECSDNVAIDEALSNTSATLVTEGENLSAAGTCVDVSGNSATDTQSGINIDTTAPSIVAGLSPEAAASGWWNKDTGAPTVTYTCDDALSGIAAGDCPTPHTFGEGADQLHSGTVQDRAGNTATVGVDDVDVDLTAPSVSWVEGPQDGSSYYFGSVPAAPTCLATDELSGVGPCELPTGYSSATGSHTLTATATDTAGNTTTLTRHYTVLAWTLGGFYQPVDLGGVWNTVKGGSTVPLKFEVFAGPTELTDTAVVDSFTVTKTSCPSGNAVTDELVGLTTTGNTQLRYDSTGGQFIQNWQTPKSPGSCYRVSMSTDDDSSITAYFKLK